MALGLQSAQMDGTIYGVRLASAEEARTKANLQTSSMTDSGWLLGYGLGLNKRLEHDLTSYCIISFGFQGGLFSFRFLKLNKNVSLFSGILCILAPSRDLVFCG